MIAHKVRTTRRELLGRAGRTVLAGKILAGAIGVHAAQSGRKVRMGVVGGGFGASFYWHQHPDCIVHAVSDLRDDRRKKLMELRTVV